MGKKIQNEKVNVKESILLNDQDYLTITLNNLKELVKNLTVALTEASNSNLYKEYKNMFDKLIKLQRATYEVCFKNGWYVLEESESKKVTTLIDDLNNKLKNIQEKNA